MNAASSSRDLGSALGRIMRMIALAIGVAFVFRSMVMAPYWVPSGSMMPTLQVGDYIFASRWDYGISPRSFLTSASASPSLGKRLPARGDIVLFQNPTQPGVTMVKRVVGLPGDRIALRHGVLLLNGKKASAREAGDFLAPVRGVNCVIVPGVVDQRASLPDGSSACRFQRFVETLPGGSQYATLNIAAAYSDEFPEVVVPAGHLFVLGDNRDDSLDSRFSYLRGGVGFVPVDMLIGKLRFVAGDDGHGGRFLGSRPLDGG